MKKILIVILIATIFPLRAFAASADSSTVLLIHADGADATTVFSDSARQRTITTTGNPQVDTAQSKFGGSSILFVGGGTNLNRLAIAHSDDLYFGAGDFTIDFWFRPTNTGAGDRVLYYKSVFDYELSIGQNGTNVTLYLSSTGSSWDIASARTLATGLAADTWYHFAFTREGSSWRSFLNGTLTDTMTSSATIANRSGALAIGGHSGVSGDFLGHIDEVRVSKGVARWTTTFTPPTGPYTGGIVISSSAVVTGDASVIGSISKGAGTFMIDHPLDPKNMLLYHSFVESPDVKNIYDGIARLDEKGEARIAMPDYFMALNSDYRYLASGVNEAMPNLHLKKGIHRRWFFFEPVFTIAGGIPGGTISWQVTGIRQDPFILKYPVIVEKLKSPDEIVDKGDCIFEPLCK